jgi:transposase
VDLLLSSGRPLKQLARELGINAYTLRQWRDKRVGRAGEATPDGAGTESTEQELRRLRREVAYLQRQRDILKKAMSILGEDPHLGMH